MVIDDWQSELHQQQHNPAERKYQTIKFMANTIHDMKTDKQFVITLEDTIVRMVHQPS